MLDVGGSPQLLDLLWVGEGFPEDVRRSLATMPRETASDQLLVLVARRMSPGARGELEARGISWVDETGAAWVRGPGLLIDRQPAATSDKRTRSGAWSWSPGAAAVGEVVLAQTSARPGGGSEFELGREAAVAELAGVSVATASQTLRAWQREGWVENRGGERGPSARRVLVAPGDLLSSWAAWVNTQPAAEVHFHVLFQDARSWALTELVDLMPPRARWCIGGLVASETYAPFVTAIPQVLCHVAAEDLEHARDRLLKARGVRLVERGARLILRSAPTATIALACATEGAPLASPPRVYVDLLSDGVRGPEVAAHLREAVLGF